MEKIQKVVFDISIKSILKILAVLAGLWLAYALRDVIVILVVVAIIVIALEPFVHKLSDQGIPRGLSVIVLYLALISFLSMILYFLIPPIANQLKELTFNFPYYQDKISQIDLGGATSTISNILDDLSSKLSSITGNIISGIVGIFGGLVSTVTVLVLTYYFLVDKQGITKMALKFIPQNQKDKFIETINKVSVKLGDWIQGQLVLMLAIGLVDWIALSIIGIPYALVLGVLSGLLEIVPVIGPVVAAVFAVFIALVASVPVWKIIAVVVVYILIQQLENHILVPKIMQKAVGLSPIMVIIAILIGSKLLGVGGALLAVPVAAGIQVLIEEYSPSKRKQTQQS